LALILNLGRDDYGAAAKQVAARVRARDRGAGPGERTAERPALTARGVEIAAVSERAGLAIRLHVEANARYIERTRHVGPALEERAVLASGAQAEAVELARDVSGRGLEPLARRVAALQR